MAAKQSKTSVHNLEWIRNIGIIAHIDAGKTTVTERMLFYSGFVHRVGMVDNGTTTTDFDPEEQQRGITIQSACVTFPWKRNTDDAAQPVQEVSINLIDTPGHVDFTAEVERSLRVLDGAVVVFSAREGVEAQSETVWRQADRYHVPRIAFINKMDREGANFHDVFEEIGKRLECSPVALEIPVGSGPPHTADAFRAVIDLVHMKQLRFAADTQDNAIFVEEIPEELREDAELWRATLLDKLSLYDEELTDAILEEREIPATMLHRAIRKTTLSGELIPVLCGAALDGIGVQPVLDAVAAYLPSPMERPPVEGVSPKKQKHNKSAAKRHQDESETAADSEEATEEDVSQRLLREGGSVEKRSPSPDEPFCGLLFKIEAAKHGDLGFVRVYSGRLKAGMRVLNPGRNVKENVPQLWRIQADHKEQIDEAVAGDIVGIIGLRETITGDTLCETTAPLLLESIRFPETVISVAIEPQNAVERKKLGEVLDLLKRQDPTLRTQVNEETGQTLLSGMGELHLEVIANRLVRDYRLNVRVHKPRVSYRETIRQPVTVTEVCRRNIGGQNLYAELTIRLEPIETTGDAERLPVLVSPDLYRGPDGEPVSSRTAEFAEVAIDALRDVTEGGGSLGFPLMNVKTTLLNLVMSETETNEMAIRIAASEAFGKALSQGGVELLEPVMKLEVTTPEEFMGDFVSDIQRRRGLVTHTSQRGRLTVIEAQVPLAELFGYSNVMRGLSQGRASSSMEPSHYGPAPDEVLRRWLG